MDVTSFDNDSIILAGIVLIIWEAIMVIMYFVLSVPIMALLNAILGCGTTPYLTMLGPEYRLVFNMIFAIAFAIPIVWFFLWVFKREYGSSMYRYY